MEPARPDEPTPHTDPHGGRWLDDSNNVWRLIYVFWGLCALLVLIDLPALFGFEVYHKHATVHGYWWEDQVGFHALYGFVACVALVEAAKLLRKVVMRAEDYYEQL